MVPSEDGKETTGLTETGLHLEVEEVPEPEKGLVSTDNKPSYLYPDTDKLGFYRNLKVQVQCPVLQYTTTVEQGDIRRSSLGLYLRSI